MELIDLGRTPITEANPAGQEIRTDPDFDALSGELEKLSSPAMSGALDWNKVLHLAAKILREKSKDLLVAAYLSVALLKTEGLAGLAAGTAILRDLLLTFWDDLYPSKKRMRGRVNAVEWWAEKVREGISGMEAQRWPREKRDLFLDNLHAVDAFLADNMPDAPLLAPLVANIRSLIPTEEDRPVASPGLAAAESPRPAPEAASPKTAAGAAAAKDAGGVEDADKLITAGLALLGRAAALLHQQDLLNALSFRLNRLAAWLPVTAPPPVNEGNRTFLPPPDEEVRNSLTRLYQSGSWRNLLDMAERRVREFLFWIDLSRYAAESLARMEKHDAGEMVSQETCRYVKRLAGVERLAFADGTPFANDETREWLKSLSQAETGPAGINADSVERLVEQELAEARELVRKNELAHAFNAFRTRQTTAQTARERLLWEMGLVRLLIMAKQTRLIKPHLGEIVRHVDYYHLEEWEPALAGDALAVVLTGLGIFEEKDEALKDRVLGRIALLDPARAVDFIF